MRLAKTGVFCFFVANKATKGAVSDAIHTQFGVDVTEVRTSKTYPKIKRSMTKTKRSFKTAPYKKALVMIKKGQKIPLFELGEDKESKAKKS